MVEPGREVLWEYNYFFKVETITYTHLVIFFWQGEGKKDREKGKAESVWKQEVFC